MQESRHTNTYIEELKWKLMSDCVFSLNGEDGVSFKFNFGPANLGM